MLVSLIYARPNCPQNGCWLFDRSQVYYWRFGAWPGWQFQMALSPWMTKKTCNIEGFHTLSLSNFTLKITLIVWTKVIIFANFMMSRWGGSWAACTCLCSTARRGSRPSATSPTITSRPWASTMDGAFRFDINQLGQLGQHNELDSHGCIVLFRCCWRTASTSSMWSDKCFSPMPSLDTSFLSR